MGYYKPLRKKIARGQRFGANPGWGPNPAGGHNGDDYLSQAGEPVYAAGWGTVIHAGTFDSTYADNFGWNLNFGGNMIVLNLDGDTAPYIEYGHLEQIHVKAGDRVAPLQVIATTGATDGGTGVITAPHLHVGVLPHNFNLNTNTYGRVDPDLYLTDYPDDGLALTAQSIPSPAPLKEWFEMAKLDNEMKVEIYKAVWEGADGAPLLHNYRLNRGEWPKTILGAMDARIQNEIVAPLRQELASQGAVITKLVGALANVSAGQDLDQEKLLESIREQVRLGTAEGLKDSIDTIESTTTVTLQKEG
jgi:hypothetical protein